jgi:hypothetical protein
VPVVLGGTYFAAKYGGLTFSSAYYDVAAWKEAFKKMLVDFGYNDINFVGLDSSSSHLLTQCKDSGKNSYVLDPTTAYVYLYDMRNYNKIPIPEPIKLPQKSDLGILDLRYSMNKNVNLWLSSSTKLTLDKGIISPPIPTEFISGNCRGWARDKTICDRIEKKDKDINHNKMGK